MFWKVNNVLPTFQKCSLRFVRDLMIIPLSGKCPVFFHDQYFSRKFTNIHTIDTTHLIFICDILEYLYHNHVTITLYVIIVLMNLLCILDSNLSIFKSNIPKIHYKCVEHGTTKLINLLTNWIFIVM